MIAIVTTHKRSSHKNFFPRVQGTSFPVGSSRIGTKDKKRSVDSSTLFPAGRHIACKVLKICLQKIRKGISSLEDHRITVTSVSLQQRRSEGLFEFFIRWDC